jgi:hypothetical protein
MPITLDQIVEGTLEMPAKVVAELADRIPGFPSTPARVITV